MSARYAERAKNAMYDFLTNATRGLAAQCSAINTDMSDTYSLPTTWTTERDHRGRHLEFPVIVVVPKRTRYVEDRRPNDRILGVDTEVWLGLGYQDTTGNPHRAQILSDRAERALWECLVDENTNAGETLYNATNIEDCRIDMTESHVSPPNNRGQRAIWVKGTTRITIVESTTKS